MTDKWKFKIKNRADNQSDVLGWCESTGEIPALIGVVRQRGQSFVAERGSEKLGDFPSEKSAAQYVARHWLAEQLEPQTPEIESLPADMGNQEILPDCMMPDGAEPCKGYLQLQETAIQFAQEKQGLASQNRELRRALEDLLATHGYVSYCSEDERLADPDIKQAIKAIERRFVLSNKETKTRPADTSKIDADDAGSLWSDDEFTVIAKDE